MKERKTFSEVEAMIMQEAQAGATDFSKNAYDRNAAHF